MALSLSLGASPFDMAPHWKCVALQERLSPSAKSAWNQYTICCAAYSRPPLPLTATNLMAYMLWYVCVKLLKSSNLNSELGHLHAYCDAQDPVIAWRNFLAEIGQNQTKLILSVQTSYPAEVAPAPALTIRLGLARVFAYLRSLLPNLWAHQWIAILACMHDLVLRPKEIIPSDDFPEAVGFPGGYAYPRMADFSFVAPNAGEACAGGLLYVTAFSKTQQQLFDKRICTVAAVNQLPGAPVDAARDLRSYIEAAGLQLASPDSPVFFYRARDGSIRSKATRASLLYEFRRYILEPAGVRDASSFTLRSLRPGGATDLAAAGIPDSIVRKIGKWTAKTGMVPYNRVDHHLLHSLSKHRDSLLAVQ